MIAAGAEGIANQAVLLLESESTNQTAANVLPQARFETLAEKRPGLSMRPLASNGSETVDKQTWTENRSCYRHML